MRKPQEIAFQRNSMSTVFMLTGALEGIASMKISETKNQVLQAQNFFNKLWDIYTQLRVDSLFRYGRESEDRVAEKDLFIIITAEGGFSGDIDQKLISLLIKQYDPAQQDIVVIGHHGTVQLAQRHIEIKKSFKLPEKDENINVDPLIKIVKGYRSTSVFYQTYVSLMVQDVKRIDLQVAVEQQATDTSTKDDIISDKTYIFEPSTFSVVAHLERSMLRIALSQLILDSKLAQFASRFRAMSVASDRVGKSLDELKLSYYRAKRNVADERLKEVINGVRKAAAGRLE